MALLPENRTSGEFFFNCLPLPLVKSLERVVRHLHIHSINVIYRLIPKSIFFVGFLVKDIEEDSGQEDRQSS
jgi:hypothetical protein